MSANTLPPLPEPDGELTIRVIGRDIQIDAYRTSTMMEYGDARAAHARKAAREEAAKLCFDNSEELGTKTGRKLAPFPHECEGLHSGMTYAKAIRSLK